MSSEVLLPLLPTQYLLGHIGGTNMEAIVVYFDGSDSIFVYILAKRERELRMGNIMSNY